MCRTCCSIASYLFACLLQSYDISGSLPSRLLINELLGGRHDVPDLSKVDVGAYLDSDVDMTSLGVEDMSVDDGGVQQEIATQTDWNGAIEMLHCSDEQRGSFVQGNSTLRRSTQ